MTVADRYFPTALQGVRWLDRRVSALPRLFTPRSRRRMLDGVLDLVMFCVIATAVEVFVIDPGGAYVALCHQPTVRKVQPVLRDDDRDSLAAYMLAEETGTLLARTRSKLRKRKLRRKRRRR